MAEGMPIGNPIYKKAIDIRQNRKQYRRERQAMVW